MLVYYEYVTSFVMSNSEIRRMFKQSGIKSTDKKTTFSIDDIATPGDVRVGKRILIRLID